MKILLFRKIGSIVRQVFIVLAILPYVFALLYFFATNSFSYILVLCFQYARELMLAVTTAMSIAFRVELQVQKNHLIKKSKEVDSLRRSIRQETDNVIKEARDVSERLKSETEIKFNNLRTKINSIQRDLNELDRLVRSTREEHVGIKEQVATLLNLFKDIKDL